ncbi:MAG: dihydrofolate reductase [Clostridiales bacterium]|nr:dihydrofolate reductase [Clostridiales bacterium]
MIAIAAVSENWGLGKDGHLLFSLHADLRRFRTLTTGHTVILGRKTLATFPGGRCLPNRRNIILTSDVHFSAPGAVVVHSVQEALEAADEETFVIGGASVYEQFLSHCDRVVLTKVQAAPPADCFFPDLDTLSGWRKASVSEVQEEDGLRFAYMDYVRR